MRLRNIPRADGIIAESRHVIQEPLSVKGRWKEIFGNDRPVHIEIGMGKGKFIMELAQRHPEINFVGIERYTSVLLRAIEKREEQEEIPNLYYLCIDARELPEIFECGEVGRIYLNFSDPWPKARHAQRRLPSREFLQRYDKILAEEGCIEFKTDNRTLFDFALEEAVPGGFQVEAYTYDLHHDNVLNQGNIMTEYEEKFSSVGNLICKAVLGRKKSV